MCISAPNEVFLANKLLAHHHKDAAQVISISKLAHCFGYLYRHLGRLGRTIVSDFVRKGNFRFISFLGQVFFRWTGIALLACRVISYWVAFSMQFLLPAIPLTTSNYDVYSPSVQVKVLVDSVYAWRFSEYTTRCWNKKWHLHMIENRLDKSWCLALQVVAASGRRLINEPFGHVLAHSFPNILHRCVSLYVYERCYCCIRWYTILYISLLVICCCSWYYHYFYIIYTQ